MKDNLEIHLTSYETYKNETLERIITSLELMEKHKEKIFGKISNAINERITKLSNIKSRLVRINQIVGLYPGIEKRISIKARKNYPKEKPSFYPSLFNPDVNEYLQNMKNGYRKLNDPPINEPEVLGRRFPYDYNEKLADCTESLKLLSLVMREHNKLDQFNDRAEQISKVVMNNAAMMHSENFGGIEPVLNYTSSDFDAFGKKKISTITKEIVTESPDNNPKIEEKEEEAQKTTKPNFKKPIDSAPVNINAKIQDYEDKARFIQTDKPVFNIEIQDNILGLGNIVSVDIDEQLEENINNNEVQKPRYDEEDFNGDPNVPDQEDDDADDVPDFITYKQQNPKKLNNIFNQTGTTPNQNNATQYNSQTVAPSQTPSVPSASVPSVPSVSADIPTIPSVDIPGIPSIPSVEVPGIPSIPSVQVPGIPSIPSVEVPGIPSIPSVQVPGIPSIPSVQVPSIPSIPVPSVEVPSIPSIPSVEVPSIPSIPSVEVPSIPTIPSSAPSIPSGDIPSVSVADIPSVEPAQEVSQQELLLAAMKNLKKKGAVEIKDEPKTINKPLSFAEQLAAARNKLKPKVDFQPKVEEPKTEKPANLMDVLKKQINLRYNNLKENEDNSSEESDED